jgi:hypothetical protein
MSRITSSKSSRRPEHGAADWTDLVTEMNQSCLRSDLEGEKGFQGPVVVLCQSGRGGDKTDLTTAQTSSYKARQGNAAERT